MLSQLCSESQLHIDATLVNGFLVRQQSADHHHLAHLMNIVSFKPFQKTLSILKRHHWTAILNLYINVATHIVLQSALIA